jgi:phosphoribosylanthranilate isomerase
MTSLLHRVSITGADDHTDPVKLVKLTEDYPFVEWALLYVPHKEFYPRNPSKGWREEFLNLLSYHFKKTPRQQYVHTALHLCGSLAFYQLLANVFPGEARRYGRLQLNVNARAQEFSDAQVFEIYAKALKLGPKIILQMHESSESIIDAFSLSTAGTEIGNIHLLHDSSKGRGVTPDYWRGSFYPWGFAQGFAGGLNPDNLQANLNKLDALGIPYWIDMESGVRTDNQFDLVKVEQVLKICQAHMAATTREEI